MTTDMKIDGGKIEFRLADLRLVLPSFKGSSGKLNWKIEGDPATCAEGVDVEPVVYCPAYRPPPSVPGLSSAAVKPNPASSSVSVLSRSCP